MYDYDKTVMKFLWLSAVHFTTELRAAPPVIVPDERPNRRGGLGGTGSGGSRTRASADCADGAFRPAAARRVADAERAAQHGDERVLRVERGNDRRRAAPARPGSMRQASRSTSGVAPRAVATPAGRRRRTHFGNGARHWR